MAPRFLLVILAIAFALPNFIDKDINEPFTYNNKERYNPRLAAINSVDKLEAYVNKTAADNHIDIQSPTYDLLLSYIISCRFYHGFSHWKMNENWIAALGEKITGIGLSCKVQPAEILKHPDAGCSQQALVMMEILKRKKAAYRKVGFPHHYALEVKNNGTWYYYDPNMEPTMNLKQRMHQSWGGQNDILKTYYSTAKHNNLSYQFGNNTMAEFGPVNEIPAPRLRMFQSATGILSKILWCFPLVFIFVKKRRTKLYAVKPGNKRSFFPNLKPSFSA